MATNKYIIHILTFVLTVEVVGSLIKYFDIDVGQVLF